ncbi:MAG TPA: immunoglobulin domain-containing protein [Verrucomicrobiae bacterium]|nr:immunoglobulin domain-containing protein [Verrucomicrobiae bacterium]
MKRKPWVVLVRFALLVGLFFGITSDGESAAIWTNRSDGFWRDGTNWSRGAAPNLGLGSTLITNASSKTVTFDAAVPEANRFINSLTLAAPAGDTNTLFLQDAGTNSPLVVSNATFNMYRGAHLALSNSSLFVTGRFLSFNVWMGDVTLHSGLLVAREEPLTTNVTVITRIGRTNNANLTINGGLMHVSELLVGESPGSQFGHSLGTVRLRGGELRVSGELSLGESTSCTGLVEITGGELNVQNQLTNVMRVADYGRGELTISNANASVGNVSVARHEGSLGIVTLLSNGVLRCSDDFSIGRFSGGTGTVLVAGGQLLVTNHPIWVGREGVGTLTISNGLVHCESLHLALVPTNTARGRLTLEGGTMLITSNFALGDGTLSTGSVSVVRGDLLVTNALEQAALNIAAGAMSLEGGNVIVDSLIMTNPAGKFTLSSGNLSSRSTRIDNAHPFTVGDGTHAASLNLLGGTHRFANGLVIASNATLTGCGTVVGTITSFGKIATNCGTAGMPPTISQQPVGRTVVQGAAADFSVIATGDPPLTYQWFFGTAPGTIIVGATNPTFSITNAQAAEAGDYRAVVSNSSGSVTSLVATLRVLIPVTITNATLAGTNFTFSWETEHGLDYAVEYKERLEASTWTPLFTRVGDGNLLTVTNAVSPLSPAGFYRVRVE